MYKGIEISEFHLLANSIIYTVVFIIFCLLGVFCFVLRRKKQSEKAKKRLQNLRLKAETDTVAQKLLEKEENKMKKRKKNERAEIFLCVLITICILVSLVISVLGWCDYIIKDYVIYEGNFIVYSHTRNSSITLDDSTQISGRLGLSSGGYNGALVYTKRTHIALGYK